MFPTQVSSETGPNRYRVVSCGWRRVTLGSGELVGLVVEPSPGATEPDILDAACLDALRERIPISVAAPRRLDQALSLTMAALERSGLKAGGLELLVPAHVALMAGMEALLSLSALRDHGVGVALAGAGLGSAALIHRLPLSSVVLATELACGLPDTAVTVHELVSAAQSLDLMVVASGIETEKQRAILASLGCQVGEGELFGR